MSEVTPVKDETNFYPLGNQWAILIYKFGLVARKYMDTNLVLENYLDGSSVELEISEGVSNQDLVNFTDLFPTKLVSQYTVYMGKAFKLSLLLMGHV